MSIADTIWAQISVPVKMACGARNPKSNGHSLTFQVTIKKGWSHYIEVDLNGDDTYDIRLHAYRGSVARIEKEHLDIQVENMGEVIYGLCNPF